eukprot:2228191-Alexandrium_andersonii.AAC.1
MCIRDRSLACPGELPQASANPEALKDGDPAEAGQVAAGYKSACTKTHNQSGRPPASRRRGRVDERSTIRRARAPTEAQ